MLFKQSSGASGRILPSIKVPSIQLVFLFREKGALRSIVVDSDTGGVSIVKGTWEARLLYKSITDPVMVGIVPLVLRSGHAFQRVGLPLDWLLIDPTPLEVLFM